MHKRTREDAVYITKLPQDVTMDKLAELFGSIGVIKVCWRGISTAGKKKTP